VPSTPEYKQCPDCAESVLAAARKCRYCGYRFDSRGRPRRSLLAGLWPGFGQAIAPAELPEVLADWGVSLADGEEVRYFRLTVVDDRPGYLLATSSRLIFFVETSRGRHEKVLEHPLAVISGVSVIGRRVRPRVELRGRDFRHVVQGAGSRELERLRVHLAAYLPHD
jgi:hypothetical protein